MDEYEKIGECETCDKKDCKILYSLTLGIWQCDKCDDMSADLIWYGDE